MKSFTFLRYEILLSTSYECGMNVTNGTFKGVCLCVCLCAFVWVGWCGLVEAHNGSHCWNPAAILNRSDIRISGQFLSNVEQNNNQSTAWDIDLKTHWSLTSTSYRICDYYFSKSFLFSPQNKGQQLCVHYLCKRTAMFVSTPDYNKLTVKLADADELFICHFPFACLCDFTGTGVLMWWHALLAVWWRMGWRRTSSQTISAVPGASVLE